MTTLIALLISGQTFVGEEERGQRSPRRFLAPPAPSQRVKERKDGDGALARQSQQRKEQQRLHHPKTKIRAHHAQEDRESL